jgi:hypothetical protein
VTRIISDNNKITDD